MGCLGGGLQVPSEGTKKPMPVSFSDVFGRAGPVEQRDVCLTLDDADLEAELEDQSLRQLGAPAFLGTHQLTREVPFEIVGKGGRVDRCRDRVEIVEAPQATVVSAHAHARVSHQSVPRVATISV